MLSNVNYAFSSSRCEMTMKSTCKCGMIKTGLNIKGDLNVHAKSCCTTEIKIISNSSDFESNSKAGVNKVTEIISHNNLLNLPYSLLSGNNLKEVLLFYPEPIDLAVMYSSLLI